MLRGKTTRSGYVQIMEDIRPIGKRLSNLFNFGRDRREFRGLEHQLW